ncbi:MAG: ATP synthase subunit I [Nevskiales bacterium]
MKVPAPSEGAQRKTWGATAATTVALQWGVILSLGAVAWLWRGQTSGLSLLGGGAAVALPNALFALWLTLRMRQAGAGAAAVLVGEIFKLGMTIGLLLAVIVHLKPELSWLALMVGVIAALKAHWLALWVTRRY